MRAIILLLIMYTGLVSNAFELNKSIDGFSESDKTLQDILHEFHMMKKELEDLKLEISMLKAEKTNAKDDKDINEDVEELKKQMDNRRTEIGILQEHDYEIDEKIQNIETKQEQDTNNIFTEISRLSDEVKINITDVKNDLSDEINNLVIAPIGTIQGWTPVPEIGNENPVYIPECWVPCDGSIIKEGIWIGQHTPDLNVANRLTLLYNFMIVVMPYNSIEPILLSKILKSDNEFSKNWIN